MKSKIFGIPMLGLVVGLGLIVTQSAFTGSHRQLSNWGYDQQTDTFVDISNKTMDNRDKPSPGTYSCLGAENICSGQHEGTPSDVSELENPETGNFREN